MAYCTPDDVRAALRPAGETGTTAAELDDAQLDDAVREAQSVVDGYLARRYAVPFADGSVPDLAWGLTRSIAAYLATLTYRRARDLDPQDPVQLRYDHALRLLRGVADGDLWLEPQPDGGAGGGTPGGVVTTVNPYRGDLFTLDDWGLGWEPSRNARGRSNVT